MLTLIFVSVGIKFISSEQCSYADELTKTKPDVFFIVIDALRADHVGVYGYHRNTTPFIDSVSHRSLVFTRAYSASTYTCESVSSLLMGRYPSSTPWSTGWFAQIDPAVSTLPEVLQKHGYTTLCFTDHPSLEKHMFGKGFDHYVYLTDDFGQSRNGIRLVDEVLRFVNTVGKDKPIFAYIHFYDPHEPYDPPSSYYLRFADEIYPKPLRVYDEVRFNLPELVKEGFGPGDVRFEDMVLRYDAEIALSDDCVKTLYVSLQKLRKNREATWIITADHGEEFLDHGFVEHAWRLYVETIRVPLIVHIPFLQMPMRKVETEISLVDLFPTLTRYLQINWSDSGWDGIALPLAEWFKGEEGSWSRDRIIFSELYLPSRTIGRSLIKNGWQYLNWQQWLTWEQCAEYAQKQRKLREEYFSGQRVARSFCIEPEFEELLSPEDRGLPEHFVKPIEQQEMWDYFRKEWKQWCTTRPQMKTDKEKLEINPAPSKEGESKLTPDQTKTLDSQGYF